MDVYLKNYWLLNLDFIEEFSNIQYKNIPLPLLSNFYHYLSESLQTEMNSPDFLQYSTSDFNVANIQPRFEKWLEPLRQPLKVKPISGKLLLNFDYLRFEKENYLQFSRDNVLLLARWKTNEFHQIPVISLKDYESVDVSVVENYVQEISEHFAKLKNHPVFSRTEFQNKFLNDVPKMIEIIEKVDAIFRCHSISSVLVGTTEELVSRVLAITASINGIPSFCLQHGLILGEEAYLPAFASKYLVYGKYEKNWYLERGVKEEQIIVAGHPRFDAIFRSHHLKRSQVFHKLGLNANKKLVLLATQPFSTDFYVDLMNLLVDNQKIQIVIKPHPWEISKQQIDRYLNVVNKYPHVKLVKREIPLYSLISSSDLVVVANSTVGLEAMLLDKPVIVYKFPLAHRDYPYYDSLEKLSISNVSDLHKTILSILFQSSTQQLAIQIRQQFLKNNYPIKLSSPVVQKIINQHVK